MARIAFLGTGAMGAGMAGRLIEAGHDVVLYNRTRARADKVAAARAGVADSPRAAAEGAEAVFAMVGDDEASAAVWDGPDGALAADHAPGAFAIECSTLSHDRVMDLGEAARAAGYRYIDAPVTGLADTAARGELTLLVGAETADLGAARAYLAPLSKAIVHFGPVGAGTVYKLMINLMGSVQIAAAAEGLVIAEAGGLDLAQVNATLETGMAAAPQVVRNTRQMIAGDHESNIVFSGHWRHKDTLYGVRLARKLGLDAGLGKAALAAFEKLIGQGDGDLNESKVIDALRRR